MKIQRIQELTDASIVCGSEKRENDVQCAFASDLMSDVLTLDCGDVLLVTGLCNLQTIVPRRWRKFLIYFSCGGRK